MNHPILILCAGKQTRFLGGPKSLVPAGENSTLLLHTWLQLGPRTRDTMVVTKDEEIARYCDVHSIPTISEAGGTTCGTLAALREWYGEDSTTILLGDVWWDTALPAVLTEDQPLGIVFYTDTLDIFAVSWRAAYNSLVGTAAKDCDAPALGKLFCLAKHLPPRARNFQFVDDRTQDFDTYNQWVMWSSGRYKNELWGRRRRGTWLF